MCFLMARKTKKVGIAGKYGVRYGVKVRNRLRDAEAKAAAYHECPECELQKVKRVSTGIFQCRHCGFKYASGAYAPAPLRTYKRKGLVEDTTPSKFALEDKE